MSEIPLFPNEVDERAESVALSRRLAALEAELARIRPVYEAACAGAEQIRSFISRHEAVYGTTCATLRLIADAVDAARSPQ